MKRKITIVYSRFNENPCFTVNESTYEQMYQDELIYDDMGEKLKKFREHKFACLGDSEKLFEVDVFQLLDLLLPKETAEIKGYRMMINFEPIYKNEIKNVEDKIYEWHLHIKMQRSISCSIY